MELCAVSVIGRNAGELTFALDHHLCDNLCNRWLKQNLGPQQSLNLKLSVAKEDYHTPRLSFVMRQICDIEDHGRHWFPELPDRCQPAQMGTGGSDLLPFP